MITFKKNIITLALSGALIGGLSSTAHAQQAEASINSQSQEKVTSAELSKFADALTEVQSVNQNAQQQMVKIITDGGLDVNRFNTIQKAKMNPETAVTATDEELAMHTAIVAKLKAMQPELENKMKSIIKRHGLTFDRYKEVAMALQNDKSLQQKFQGIMMKKQTEG